MAKVVTIKILVDEDDDSVIASGLHEMLQTASTPVDEDDVDAPTFIIDWLIDRNLEPVSNEVDDAIMNDTYVSGEAFIK